MEFIAGGRGSGEYTHNTAPELAAEAKPDAAPDRRGMTAFPGSKLTDAPPAGKRGRSAAEARREEVVVVHFAAEGEGCSVKARLTPDGWRYRWVYASIWDDDDAELLGIGTQSESEERSSLAEALPERWYEIPRPCGVHPNWVPWFQDAISKVVAGIADKAERTRVTKRWRQALQG